LQRRWEQNWALPATDKQLIRARSQGIDVVPKIHYPDGVIAGILNRQERATAYGHRFTAGRVGNLRRHWGIPCFEPTTCGPEGELLTINYPSLAQ
jgi:hypothetical protein